LKTAKIDGRFLLEQDKEKLTIANILGWSAHSGNSNEILYVILLKKIHKYHTYLS
jgi:hypothetical protein